MKDTEAAEERWPKAGHRLFVDSPPAYGAPVARHSGERFYRLPMGYKRAADILIEHAAADLVDRQNVIYAALFCYRQSVELFLKRLIEDFGGGKAPKDRHNLRRLWERFDSIASERGGIEPESLGAVRALVAEMHDADQRADGFRFAATLSGEPFVFGDRYIDLDNLREVMHGVATWFDVVYTMYSSQDD